jgi:L-rhamnose mutarotase
MSCGTNPIQQQEFQMVKRMSHMVKLKAEVIPEYKRIHAAVWPEILQAIHDANIRNYSIFLKEPENWLVAYWEYIGTDFAADTAKIKNAPRMQEWWDITDPMQQRFETAKPGEWWASMEEVFHTD